MRIVALIMCASACMGFIVVFARDADTFSDAITVGLLGAALTALLFISLRLGEVEKLVEKMNSDKEKAEQKQENKDN